MEEERKRKGKERKVTEETRKKERGKEERERK